LERGLIGVEITWVVDISVLGSGGGSGRVSAVRISFASFPNIADCLAVRVDGWFLTVSFYLLFAFHSHFRFLFLRGLPAQIRARVCSRLHGRGLTQGKMNKKEEKI
jgi:hypothetical protein